jgi:hypothetical protein
MVMLAFSADAFAGRRVRTFGAPAASSAKEKKPQKPGDKTKPFAQLIKDKKKIEGLFTFYVDTSDLSVLMAIKPEQIGPLYLCSETRAAAEGAFFDNGSMAGDFPFFFKRVGESIYMMEKNLRLRADTTLPLAKALHDGITDHLYASAAVISGEEDSTKAVLVKLDDFFMRDAQNLGFFVGQQGRTGLRFDSKHSYFGEVKSFPKNSEIDVMLHYMTSQPFGGLTMQNPYSMYHRYHFSLSEIISSDDFRPRVADERVGYFMTQYQDYSTLDTYSPYVRYINRWNLRKKNPDARVSEPVEPIVYWVENTVPEEYRDAVAEGIEFWNQSFEKLGFRNAIIAKQMPDTADWDPADVRYSTVQWIVIPGGGYAVGPSRANPFTGEIYDADIRVSADFIRYMFNNAEYFIQPLSFDGEVIESDQPKLDELIEQNHGKFCCTYGAESAKEAAFGLSYALATAGDLADKDALTNEYVHAYIVELVAHEVGHTLGFRHNFKASTIYSLEDIQDRKFTRQNSTGGTVMDYTPPNLAPLGKEQGEFYASTPGPYDDFVIEYGYTDFGEISAEEEHAALKEIASKSSDPKLIYATDEDAFGSSIKSIDPTCNLFDLGNDPIAYADHKVKLTRELWHNSLKEFEKDGETYNRVLRAFQTGWRSYAETASHVSKFVGGIYHSRLFAGQVDGKLPFEVVPASEQRRAVDFVSRNVFAADAFDLPADVLNKLQPERMPDFNFSVYSVYQVDYPFHAMVLSYQNRILSRLYSPYVLGRLVDNLARVDGGAEKYTMYDMFKQVRGSIWSEAFDKKSVNSLRRQLQLRHLQYLTGIYLSTSGAYPSDARTLAANDLDVLASAAKSAAGSSVDAMSKAHFNEVVRQIEAAQGAQKEYAKR